jgi:hypothetical protein
MNANIRSNFNQIVNRFGFAKTKQAIEKLLN